MSMPVMTPVTSSGTKGDLPDLAGSGESATVLASADDLEGLELTLEILQDSAAAERISASLAALGRGERAVNIATVRGDLARAISGRLPDVVAADVIEFCNSALAFDPRQAGKPLFGPLAGCHCVRRGMYRIVYRIEEKTRTVEVLDIGQRPGIRDGL